MEIQKIELSTKTGTCQVSSDEEEGGNPNPMVARYDDMVHKRFFSKISNAI